jgi:CBS domain containing-hemolysin-like protein
MYEKEKLLNPSERKILTAALEMHDKNAESIMQPLDKTFMLDIDSKITKELLRTIYKEGFSRIPIFE